MKKSLSILILFSSFFAISGMEQHQYIPIAYAPETHPHIGIVEHNPNLDQNQPDPRTVLALPGQATRWAMRELLVNYHFNFPENSIASYLIHPLKNSILKRAKPAITQLTPFSNNIIETIDNAGLNSNGTQLFVVRSGTKPNYIVNIDNGEITAVQKPDQTDIATYMTVNYNHDDSLVVTASREVAQWITHIDIWDIINKCHLKRITLPNTRCADVVWHPHKNVIAWGDSSGNITLYDLQSDQQATMSHGHYNRILHIAFSPCGKKLVSAGEMFNAKIWHIDQETNNLIFHKKLIGHVDAVTAATWNHDGSKIATGAANNHTIKIWDANTGECLTTLVGNQDQGSSKIVSLYWSSNKNRLYSISHEGLMHIWDLGTNTSFKKINLNFNLSQQDTWHPRNNNLTFNDIYTVSIIHISPFEQLEHFLDTDMPLDQALLIYALERSHQDNKKYALDPKSKEIFDVLPPQIQKLYKNDVREKTEKQ